MLDTDLKSKLENIKKLLDANSITQSEYNELKEEILFKKMNFGNINVNNIENTKNVFDKQYNVQRQQLNQNNYLISIILFCLMAGFWYWTSKEKQEKYNSNTTNEINSSETISNDIESYVSKVNCKICGRNFTGYGYDKIDGVWKKNTSMQTELCSPSCAMKEEKNIDEKYDEILRKHGYNSSSNSSMQDAPIQHYGEYIEGTDGRIYENNKCGLCNGTGIEKNMSSLSDDYGRICPMCNGRGVRSY